MDHSFPSSDSVCDSVDIHFRNVSLENKINTFKFQKEYDK